MERRVRVMIADDRRFSREGLHALLATAPGIEVVGEAVNGSEAVRMVESIRPDVVLMDVKMPVMDGLEATREIKRRQPDTKVVMLTMYINHQGDALAAGADDFLVKGCPVDQLIRSILNR